MRNLHDEGLKQLRLLTKACQGYDEGDKDEALNIALRLRILFHDAGQSVSVLTHLNAWGSLLLSTCEATPHQTTIWPCLVNVVVDPLLQDFVCVPRRALPRVGHFLPARDWWSAETIYTTDTGVLMTRRNIVRAVANQDGGAHIDPTLDIDYEKLVQGADWKVTFNPGNGPSVEVPLQDVHWATIRQIGYEVLASPDIQQL